VDAVSQAWDRWDRARRRALTWRGELSVPAKLSLCMAMAGVTGIVAQFRLPVPGTPVPVTGQVLAVLLSGIALGSGWGALSQVFYVGIGAAGLPWFAGSVGGAAILLGPTGGYLLGFVPAAMLIGVLTGRSRTLRHPLGMIPVMLLAVGVIYLCGTLQLAAVMHLDMRQAFDKGVAPFIVWDVAKAFLAAGAGAAALPRKA